MWQEWEESSLTLPKTGEKSFEPNESWLEKRQIENGIKKRKELLNLQRVERTSGLSTAKWLPDKKKALVTKTCGKSINNFGASEKSSMYLLPEEALYLAETVMHSFILLSFDDLFVCTFFNTL